jgi:2-polyprenyl-3-methyl-5-hydroxy-6-metoxy-1,4-benzoquinol methylase
VRFLANRDTAALEEMDRPDCDPQRLERTYAQFGLVNAAVSGWRRIYHRDLRPRFAGNGTTTLLDIGCGGGDVARSLGRWAARDGLDLKITATDPDRRALAFALAQPPVPGLEFRHAFSSELVAEGFTADLVISNHVLHHLPGPALQELMADSEALATRFAVHNDLQRSAAAYAFFSAGTLPFFHRSFIRADGLTSLRRSYTTAELAQVARPGWLVRRTAPFRNLLVLEAGREPGA